jgi:DNA replication protein DnaC
VKTAQYVTAPPGVGKSHLAQALAHEACRRGHEVLFINTAKMLAHLAGGRADGTHEQRLARYTRPDLLVLDDFGLKALRPPGPEDLYDVINERYEKASTGPSFRAEATKKQVTTRRARAAN